MPPPAKRVRPTSAERKGKTARSGHESGPGLRDEAVASASDSDAAAHREAKLRDALGFFIKMLDLQPEDFSGAFPDLGSEMTQLLQKDFVQALQTAIKMSNDAIIRDAMLPDRLGELDKLVTQADERAASATSDELPPDTYRNNLDLTTALSAVANPAHEQRLNEMQAEIDALEAANRVKFEAMLTSQAEAAATQQMFDSTLTDLAQVSTIPCYSVCCLLTDLVGAGG